MPHLLAQIRFEPNGFWHILSNCQRAKTPCPAGSPIRQKEIIQKWCVIVKEQMEMLRGDIHRISASGFGLDSWRLVPDGGAKSGLNVLCALHELLGFVIAIQFAQEISVAGEIFRQIVAVNALIIFR